MRTFNINKIFWVTKISFFALIFISSCNTYSQVNPTDTTGYNIGRMALKKPTSILSAYTYDPATNRYIYNSSLGEFNLNYPIILTPKEYQELVQRESMRAYFRKKLDAIEGKKEGSEDGKKDLLPRYYVNSGFFETIFGSNTINVQPRGSVEMDLGMRYAKQDNPAFSPRNRVTTTFDFDQRINMSLTGKVGTRLNINANYDTQSSFAFQNLIKLEYTPVEDAILQKLEVGNVSMPLNNTLIRGAQSLFGVKAQLQFGKTTVTTVFSEQKSQTKSVTAQGGGTLQDFQFFALDYDSDRHFFLSQYFRSRYDIALRKYPFIDSRVQITRIEVWITNRQTRVNTSLDGNNLRNIIALQDLGEAQLPSIPDQEVIGLNPIPGGFFNAPSNSPAKNSNNDFDPALIQAGGGLLNPNIREIITSGSGFNFNASEGLDYSKLENARKLTTNEFTFHPQLGYVSLQQRLANDEVIAVAYQYTIGDQVHQVGEFGNDGVESTVVNSNTNIPSTQSLILKMLKSNLTNIDKPVWNLMMKNIYQIQGGSQLTQEDFRFNILYTDPSPLNYITAAGNPPLALPIDVNETPLLNVFNVDQLNYTNDPQVGGDGFFDFYPGITVDTQNGRIIFTTVEPFGRHLFNKLKTANPLEDYDNTITGYNSNQSKYVFRNMYKSTQAAALQESEKNKFLLRGRYKSSSGDGIPIRAFNVPRGSVVVTAGGRTLLEGVDYTVNYQLGRVNIVDPTLKASSTPIQISVENNSVFGQQTRRFFGVNVEHKFSDKFLLGATLLKMTERPFTQKSSFGQESVNNTIFGINTNYSTTLPFLTRLVNKIPNVDTDVPSNLSLRGEVAFLKPNTPKADNFQGESTLYVDDFEGYQSTIDMKSANSWSLSSVPERNNTSTYSFFGNANDLSYGFKRAKMSWYTVDPIFYTSQRPSGITNADMVLNKTRRIFIDEIFPVTDIAQGQQTVINTLDLSYYPSERGPYNYNPAASATNILPNPQQNFGGITRSINSTNFEQANVEYIQFWLMDPYFGTNEVLPTNTGEIYFNIGEISEDILKDGRKQYENGLPESGSTQVSIPSIWGKTPASQSLIYAFDTNEANRALQDVGFDGLNDNDEASLNPQFSAQLDPAADNYTFYLTANGNVVERYKNYNGVEKNSPVNVTDSNRGSSTLPDVEDINRDNTMNTINAYYEYKVSIKPNMIVGEDYITDVRELPIRQQGSGSLPLPAVRWLQFKVPVAQYDNKIGSISDFRSIRFMRMFMTGFTNDITMRFGVLELVRGEWRRFTSTLDLLETTAQNDLDNTAFDVLAVNVEENSNRVPVNYVLPPGVQREQHFNNNTVINQNEQSLSLRVTKKNSALPGGLEPGDSRAVFKNLEIDIRQFEKLKMFIHAESIENNLDSNRLLDDEMVAFIRFGNDFTQNFYQVEIPLKTTPHGTSNPQEIWPEANEIDLNLELLTKLKILIINGANPNPDEIYFKDEDELDPSLSNKPNKLRLGIKGNPNFGLVRTLMIGLRNTKTGNVDLNSVRGEVWFNELRVAGLKNKGGMAAILNIDTNAADLVNVSATGRMSTIGFGALEDGVNERSREDSYQYDIVTNVNVGKLFPKKWKLTLPFNYAIGEQTLTPEYDPFNQDIKLQQLLDVTADAAERDNIKNRAIDYTKRSSINFIGVKKERGEKQKPHIYDIENFTLYHSYSEVEKHSYEIEDYNDQQAKSGADYSYTFNNKPVEPFKSAKFMKKSQYWKMLSDFNFNYLPSNINFSSNIIRQYNVQKFRQVDVQGLGLTPLYRRNYMFNYVYGFNYNLTKSLRINYNVSRNNLVRNYFDEFGIPDEENTIFDSYLDIGSPDLHNQQFVVNYELPLNKLPFLSFVKSTYSFTGTFNWQRASQALSSYISETGIEYDLGNTIQNSGSHRLNTSLNMDLFYKYIGLVKGVKQPVKKANSLPPKPGEKITKVNQPQENKSNVFLDGLIGVVTSVKNIQVNYTQNTGTILPGYTQNLGFWGTSRPSLGFVFGSQDDIRYEAAKSGWLTNYPEFNQNYSEVLNKQLSFTSKIDLFPDLTIDLIANRNYMENFTEQYDVTNGQYNSRSPYTTGNYSISTVLINTSFGKSDEFSSEAFQIFRDNRLVIANRLAAGLYGSNIPRYGDAANPIPTNTTDPNYAFYLSNQGFPVGYGKNNQAVLIPSFLAAYSGKDASGHDLGLFKDIPIPNWTVKYNGLMRYTFFKERFKRFSIQHGYRASYTINSFRSNFEYSQNPGSQDNGGFGNFYNETIVQNVNLVEQFNPLVKFDFEMKNSLKILAELKKDRTLSMSFDNNLLTEIKGFEYVLGLGYRFKDVIITSSLADNPQGVIKSDINIKADVTLRDNKTIVRYLDYDNNQLGGGQNIWSLKLTADYTFGKNLTAIFYYDHSFSKAVISTAFPLTTIRSGFTLRYNFGN